MKKLLVTGANGFIGKNLISALTGFKVFPFDKEHDRDYLYSVLKDVDFIFHLAANIKGDYGSNYDLTELIIRKLEEYDNKPTIIFASTIQEGTEYSKMKRKEEKILENYNNAYIYRLPNVFGQWCRPNYNNVVATFIHNVLTGKGLTINDPDKVVSLVYIDDLVREFQRVMNSNKIYGYFLEVKPVYEITVGKLAEVIQSFDIDETLFKKLYKTYQS